MAKFIKSYNKNTGKRFAWLVGILLSLCAAVLLAVLKKWIFAAAALAVCFVIAVCFYNTAKRLKSGIDGENQTAKLLAKKLPRKYIVMQNFTVKCGPTAEFDCIVVSPKGVAAIEVKNYAGNLTGKMQDEYWQQTRSGKNNITIEKQVKNPYKQCERQAKVLNNVIQSCAVRAPLKANVYFSNNYINVNIKDKNIKILTDEKQLLGFITSGADSLSQSAISTVVNAIKQCSI